MKKFLIATSFLIVLAALAVAAARYAPVLLSPSVPDDALIIPFITPSGTIEARQAVTGEIEPTFADKIFERVRMPQAVKNWVEKMFNLTRVPQIVVDEFDQGESAFLAPSQPSNFIIFQCPAGTNIPMRGVIPPDNFESPELYWYWGPYDETPNETAARRFNLGESASQIFDKQRFGGNAAAVSYADFLTLNRSIQKGGVYVMYGESSGQTAVRCSRRCGDSVLDADMDEECDDGNTADGDGCSSKCIVELNCIPKSEHNEQECENNNRGSQKDSGAAE